MKKSIFPLISFVFVLACQQTGGITDDTAKDIDEQTEQVLAESQEPREDSGATDKDVKEAEINNQFTAISAEKFKEGIFPAHSFGELYPEDANYTTDEVLKAENKLLNSIEIAERQGDNLIIGSIEFLSEIRNSYWFQGITLTGYMFILNRFTKNGIGFSKMILVNSDGSSLIELSNTRIIYELDNGRLIQVYSEPIPGKPNGGVKLLEVRDDLVLIEIVEVNFNNKSPRDIKTMGENLILVELAVDDSGELPPEFVKIKY